MRLCLRQTSRTSRLNRFRSVALPTFRLAVMPSLVQPGLGAYSTRMSCRWIFLPRCCTARYSRRFRSRRHFGKRRELSDPPPRDWLIQALLLRDAHAQTATSLATATTKDLPAGLGAHPLAKAMNPGASLVVRLIRPLHGPTPCKREHSITAFFTGVNWGGLTQLNHPCLPHHALDCPSRKRLLAASDCAMTFVSDEILTS